MDTATHSTLHDSTRDAPDTQSIDILTHNARHYSRCPRFRSQRKIRSTVFFVVFFLRSSTHISGQHLLVGHGRLRTYRLQLTVLFINHNIMSVLLTARHYIKITTNKSIAPEKRLIRRRLVSRVFGEATAKQLHGMPDVFL